MRRLPHWCVPATFALGLALGACVNQHGGEQRMAEARAVDNQRRVAARAEAAQRREAIRATALPPDYREQIDADFVRTLKDPDSRKIAYQGNPYGSLICGTVNARNSYGGYTGQQFFFAYFSQAGTLAARLVFSPQDIEALHELRVSPYTLWTAQLYLENMLYADCGGR